MQPQKQQEITQVHDDALYSQQITELSNTRHDEHKHNFFFMTVQYDLDTLANGRMYIEKMCKRQVRIEGNRTETNHTQRKR